MSESASSGTSLDDYRVQIVCRGGEGDGDVVAQGSGTSLDVKVSKGAAIVCTITNEAKENAGDVSPVLSCVVFDGNTPALADWGYSNKSGVPVVIPIGGANHFTPDPRRPEPACRVSGGVVRGRLPDAVRRGECADLDAVGPLCDGGLELTALHRDGRGAEGRRACGRIRVASTS